MAARAAAFARCSIARSAWLDLRGATQEALQALRRVGSAAAAS
jgi:hypothetical protein